MPQESNISGFKPLISGKCVWELSRNRKIITTDVHLKLTDIAEHIIYVFTLYCSFFFLQPIKAHNIHHFCTMPSRVELPPHLCKLTRDEHTKDKFRHGTEKPMDVNFKVQCMYMYVCTVYVVIIAWALLLGTSSLPSSLHCSGPRLVQICSFNCMKQPQLKAGWDSTCSPL